MKIFFLMSLLVNSSQIYGKNNNQDDKLKMFLAESWEYSLSRSPQTAVNYGKSEFANQLNDVSSLYQSETAIGYEKLLGKLSKINRNKLSNHNKINYDMS
ncbi:MAG: hypothetical protein AB8B80_09885, partial [Marinicellaceae bacterium]